MTDRDTLEARVAELEVRLTLQQDELDKLSQELFHQQRQLEGALARLKLLESRRAATEEPPAPTEELPPHY